MAILVFFWRFLWAQMAKLSPIHFKIGLPIILYVNIGQTKFESDILKIVAKIRGFWPKWARPPILSQFLDGRILVIFHPILTFFFFKLLVF